ncbi:hypothetical protein L208DRAFT_276188 [Tricholoma matsutake]|nr:hypothetical protein L208DRAFT_276188 [Tricholoma matsutake 945]
MEGYALCRLVLDGSLGGVLKCKQAGCKTQWYHLQCVELQQEPRSWVCMACEASGRGRRPTQMMSYYYI